MAKQEVVGYIDCGIDKKGKQLVVYLPAVVDMEVDTANESGELVTLRYMHDVKRAMGADHSKLFLESIGLRQVKTSGIIVPDVAQPRFGRR